MRFLCLGFLIVFTATQVLLQAASRPEAWRVERSPGSSQFHLAAMRSIVLPEASGAALTAAADDLRDVFEQRYGWAPELVEQGIHSPKQAMILELETVSDSKGNDGGFFVRQTGSRIYISAASQQGLIHGIYAFAADVLGARWYWPGELGFEFVGDAPERFTRTRWRETPAYTMRTMAPMDGDYGRRNRLVRQFHFNHALARVFTPELFAAEPKVFSEIRGRRRVPVGSGGVDPQPDFTHPRTVELAAEAALAHFEQNPDSQSFSLSINDNSLFDDTAATEAKVSPLRYFRGRPDYTDLVFEFMNAVAEKVFEEAGAWDTPSGEPRFLTALAYYWTEQSPTIQVHPRVMPVLTSDRAQWHDPAYRAQDKALIERWASSGAERIATWDYYFGSPYPYPRQFTRWIGESLSFMAEAGVTVFYSQMPSAWGLDGPKTWLAASLLWDPTRDIDVLLTEYYDNFFGAASEAIRAFDEAAERHRDAHEGVAEWIKFYKDEAGVELFSASLLAEMRQLIETAQSLLADDPRRAARVQVVSDAFQLTERYAAFHRARVELVQRALNRLLGNADNAPSAAELENYFASREAFQSYAAELVKDPMHQRLTAFTRMPQSDPVPLVLAAMALEDGIPEDYPEYPEERRIAETWAADSGTFHSMFANVKMKPTDAAPRPRDFLGPPLPSIPGWHFDFRAFESLNVQAFPEGGLRVTGADMFSIFTDVPVIPEMDYMLDATLAYHISPDNRIQIRLSWTDSSGKELRADLPLRLPNGPSAPNQRVIVPLQAPTHAYNLRVHFVISRQYPDDFLQLQRVDFGLVR